MTDRFSDFPLRVASALLLGALFVGGLYLGGLFFHGFVILFWVLALVELFALIRNSERFLFMHAIALLAISASALFIIQLFNAGESRLIASVVLCVIASDIGGYLGGRLIGGAKLWPQVSPNKTWAGALSAFILAAVFSLLFAVFFDEKLLREGGIFLALLQGGGISVAAQMGDIFESALKRRAGVKDSGRFVPGHGGVLDRFDGVVGAFLPVGLVMWIIPL